MLEILQDYDWAEAFGFAGETDQSNASNLRGALPTVAYDLTPFTREDVEEIAAFDEGENDGDEWVIYGKLKDGRWFCIEAWCDYTGWDCQSGGLATIGNTREEIERFGLSESNRERLNIQLSSI